MKHTDVIKQEYIPQYIETHKIFYRTMSKMLSDISFIEACVSLQDHDLQHDWITIKHLHGSIFENLIMRTYRCFFDNSGPDSTNIFKFKNNVISKFLKEEFVEGIKDQVANLPIEDKIYKKTKYEFLQNNILRLRDAYIGHELLNAPDAEVDLTDIRDLVDRGIELFQVLSFEPKHFYDPLLEGDGYDFSKEKVYTKKSMTDFIRYTVLSSNFIQRIYCDLTPECEGLFAEKILKTIDDINNTKQGEDTE